MSSLLSIASQDKRQNKEKQIDRGISRVYILLLNIFKS